MLKIVTKSLGLLSLMLFIVSTVAAQERYTTGSRESAAAETYRLRIENTEYGRVEISLDQGARYVLIGRVTRPATSASSDTTASSGIVLRGGAEGVVFSVGPRRVLKLRPYFTTVPITIKRRRTNLLRPRGPESGAIITDLTPGIGPFGDIMPPFRTAVRLQADFDPLGSFPDQYVPADGDTYVALVSLPSLDETRVRSRIDRLAASYAADAFARARAAKRTIVSGNLTLQAKLPRDEPEPIGAVSYLIDGDTVSARNHEPWTYTVDTRRLTDGEHVVEIRAIDGSGAQISHVRSLIYVRNAKP